MLVRTRGMLVAWDIRSLLTLSAFFAFLQIL